MIKPPSAYTTSLALGVRRGHQKVTQIIFIGMMAGWYIGFGMLLVLSCGLDTPEIAKANLGLTKMLAGLYGLPFGLFMVSMTGADLCTSNFAMVPLALLEGKITWKQALKSLGTSWCANFVGSLFLAWLVHASHAVPHAAVVVKATTIKANLPFHIAVAKGVLCNWLVCTGAVLANGTDSPIGKFICILAPISIFVSEGFEHCVANMFAMPYGILMGAEYGWYKALFHNLLPVTLGNILGGAGPVALMMWLGYGSRNGKPLPTWNEDGQWPRLGNSSEMRQKHHSRDQLSMTTHSEAFSEL